MSKMIQNDIAHAWAAMVALWTAVSIYKDRHYVSLPIHPSMNVPSSICPPSLIPVPERLQMPHSLAC